MNSNIRIFKELNAKGRLIFAEPDVNTKFIFTIWFDYTRQLMNSLREGDLVAVQNFLTNSSEIHWSVLQITSTLPTHYALGPTKNDVSGYPGYIMEAAGNLPTDWLGQENTSSEDTTKIVCNAIPINFEFVEGKNDVDNYPIIMEDNSIPMVGSEVRLLSVEMSGRIFNHNIDKKDWNIIIGTLTRERNINIMMRPYDAISTHIGIFGFTGVGKSNFVSTMIYNLFNSGQILKILIFDLNNEYISLLSDVLSDNNLDANILCIGENTLPQATVDFMKGNQKISEQSAIEQYLQDIYLPRSLRSHKLELENFVRDILKNKKIKVLEEEFSNLPDYLESLKEDLYDQSTYPSHRIYIDQLINNIIQKHGNQTLTATLARDILDNFDNIVIETDNMEDMPIKSNNESIMKKINMIKFNLRRIAQNPTQGFQPDFLMKYQDIVKILNNERRSSIIVINSFDPDEIRTKAKYILESLYMERRRRGLISPLVLAIFDEADEFIPQDIKGNESYSRSKRIIETIARRGRKYGIGLAIATQRATYLDTNIMGQLHTYFISKLPRSSDRERISEAFSLSEEILSQTFKFRKGDWLFISHEAAGLESVPIPIHSNNAEERILKYIKQNDQDH
jgi:hypothetical protein